MALAQRSALISFWAWTRQVATRAAWPLLCLGIASLVALPLVSLATHIGKPSDGTWQHLAETVLWGYCVNTLLLAVGVGFGTLLMGVPTAWLVTMYRFPGSRAFAWMLLLPLAIPSYLLAYAATDVLQFSGPVQTWLRETFQWSRQDYWFPDVRTVPGAIAILSLCLYPYVYLAARTSFLEQSVCVLDAGRTLGAGPLRRFFRIGLPLARPSIIAGLALVLMETLAEFGAVDYCAVDTFATGIYRTWMSRGSLVAAAQLSLLLLAVIAVLLSMEHWARGSARYHQATSRRRALSPERLSLPLGIAASTACGVPIVLGFGLPVGVFITMTIRDGDARAVDLLWELTRNSMTVAMLSAMAAVCLGTLLAYGDRLSPTRVVGWATRVSKLGYAVPGGVIAIGILGVAWVIENQVNDFTQAYWGWSPGLFFSGTVGAVLLGYQSRFLSVSVGIIQSGLTRIRPSIDQAAQTLGKSRLTTLGRIHVPMLRSTLLCAGLLVMVDVLKELPATLILRPFNFDTLAVRVYQLASDERLSEASTGALVIILAGLIPVVILSRWMAVRPGERQHD